jgi:hypothetical protein
VSEDGERGLAARRLQHVANQLQRAGLVNNELRALFEAEALLASLDAFDALAAEVRKLMDEFFHERP